MALMSSQKNSGKIPVVVLIGGVLLSGIVSLFAPDDTGEISPADAIIAEATPAPDSKLIPTIESTETSSPEPNAALTPESTPELTIAPTSEPAPEPTAAPTPEPAPEPTAVPTPESAPVTDPEPAANIDRNNTNEFTYVLNTNTHKIHYPSCRSVPTIKPENYATTNKSVDELLGEGYTKCRNCWK